MSSLSSLPLRGSAAGRAPGRLGQSLGSVRPSQLLLAIPLFLALYATVLRSSIGTRSDMLMGMPDLDHESYRWVQAGCVQCVGLPTGVNGSAEAVLLLYTLVAQSAPDHV